MKRFTLLTFLLFAFFGAFAQTITVKSFQPLSMDMTASSLEGKRIDQNGHVAALIKIVTSETGFAFDGGTLGIVDTKQKVGEIWVWVPYGSRKISIMHQQLGVLRDYRYPIEIESERTYEMVLTTAKIETIIKEEVRQQYLLFQLDPPNAILEVDDMLWNVEADGTAMKYVDFGTYNYRVRASDYATEVGKVTVDDPNETKIVFVKLKSNLIDVTLTVDANAEIWVNNQKKGVCTWTGKLGSGTYKIECKQDGHETTMVSKEITTKMDGETITLPAPKPIYGSLNVESTPQIATLYIDGKEIGKTPKSVNEILIGEHEIKLTKDGYEDHIETITITKGERKQINATLNKKEAAQQPIATTTSFSEEQTFIVDGVSFTMKLVEGGSFQMGSNNSDAEGDEKPVHSVTLSNYYLGETEVTQALWKAVMGSEPSYNGGWVSDYGKGNDYPAYRVSWNDIQEFLTKLNRLTGEQFRLPTEAEWEYAARGGKKSKGYKYAGSNNIGNVAWYDDNSSSKTHAVKTKQANELGLYDMSGNVWEWCSDWYDSYSSGSQTNPQGPSSGSYRVLRGGSWDFNARYCRVSYRSGNGPAFRRINLGFRLCLPQ